MPRLVDLTGKRFGRLVVIKRVVNNKWGQSRWLCLCDCGKKPIVSNTHLRTGSVQSCGCMNIEKLTRHGGAKRGKRLKIYAVWGAMIQRCTNPNNRQWKNYGNRGITVCERWMKFENFLEDMGKPPGHGYSIERKDNNGNYCKENCIWATRKEQNRNKRDNHLITFGGKTQCLTDWAEEIGIKQETILKRFRISWSIEKALTTPVKKRRKR